jgi:hypothetical protein
MAKSADLTGKQFLVRIFFRSIAALVIATALVYALDAAILRYRVSTNKNPYGAVTVRPYYAIPRKDAKIELMFDDPRDETCVNSLFPQMGDSPCWYLRKHPEKRIDM